MSSLILRLQKTWNAVWPKPGRDRLSNRVRVAIARNDSMSEVLVRVIQFVIFALWGLIFLAAPKPDPDTVSQVPPVITGYLVFTLLLLWLAVKNQMRGWLIYLSIVVDMVLLTYLIWSFHIQYGQPASFSLKSVEVMNYFVLIALRTLRFETRYVLAAGGAAALCWIGLVLYVVEAVPGDPMITRSYVDYLTTNSVLLGAEISKIIAMLMVTGILALAVRRAHSFLVRSVTESSAARDLSRFVANDVVAQIRDSEMSLKAGDGVRRNAAILNVDIRGFTKLVAEIPPARSMKLLSDYQHRIVPIVHRHKGAIDKFMGDGIMITFGAVVEDSEYAANALRCIDDILKSIERWDGPSSDLEINIAAMAGPVVFGAVGDGDRLEMTVIGPPVNLSAKLEKHNKELGTHALSGEVLYDLALEQGYRPAKRRRNSIRRLSTRLVDHDEDLNVVILA